MARNKKPTIPAVADAKRMANFAFTTCAASGNAKFATKIAIVKPTPPKIPAPIICIHDVFSGKRAILVLITRKLNSKIPKGLPSNRPKNTPKNTGLATSSPNELPSSETSALVSANSGRIKKYTHGYNVCSSRVAGGTTLRATSLKLLTVLRYTSCAETGKLGSYSFCAFSVALRLQILKRPKLMWLLAGMVKANSTPAIVECTPDMNTQYQRATPTSKYGTNEYT